MGGDEVGFFVGDLLCMYQCYFEVCGWKFEMFEEQLLEFGGVKEVIVCIVGEGVFVWMKYEFGVYCVQCVFEIESGGCIYILVVIVVVLFEVEDVDIQINVNDICIDIMWLFGVGGQYVNMMDLVVWIIYLFIGIVVISFEKLQYWNCEIVMQVLKICLFDMEC